MDPDQIDGVARDELKRVAMRVGNLERRLLDHRDLVAGLLVIVGVLTLVVLLRW